MDMNAIREHLVAQNIVGENIFFFERPEKLIVPEYIVYNFKELDGGSDIRHYQLDIKVISKNTLRTIELKDKVVNALDIFYKYCKISDEFTTIRSIKLINGGGLAKDTDTNEYVAILYFSVRI